MYVIRCFLKDTSNYYLIYRIESSTDRRNEQIFLIHLPHYKSYISKLDIRLNGTKLEFFEIHFTYNSDGKTHYSYKSKKNNPSYEAYFTAYPDQIKGKIIKEPQREVVFFEERNRLNWLLPKQSYPLKYYRENPNAFFTFPGMGIPSINALNELTPYTKEPQKDDIVLRLKDLNDNNNICVEGFLSHINRPANNNKNARSAYMISNSIKFGLVATITTNTT